MKQYIILAATACLAIAATSCSEFLEEDMRSSFTPETIYASSLGFEVGSAGLYSIARSEYNTWGEELNLHLLCQAANTREPYSKQQ